MRRWILACVLCAGCQDKSKSEDMSKQPVTTPTPTASAAPTTVVPTIPPGLPRAEDVLPKGEVSAGSLVVDNDESGLRFQIPATFKVTGNPIVESYTGTVKGNGEDATITLWASRNAFKGDVDALVTSETKNITERCGKIDLTGPVLVWVAGKVEPARGRRLLAHFSDRLDYRVLVVRAPSAYVFHCETPATAIAWGNVGVECMVRGNTFHVAPPR